MFRSAQHDRALGRIKGFKASPVRPQNFTGVWANLVMNCRMIGRALAVAVGLLAVCLPAAAEQGNPAGAAKKHLHPAGTLDPAFALTLYQPKIFSANDSSLLFHQGPVRAWSDGGQLANESAL